jgi:hypothetical protein
MSKFDIPFPELPRTSEGKRICQVVKVKPEALKEYKEVRLLTLPNHHDCPLQQLISSVTLPSGQVY